MIWPACNAWVENAFYIWKVLSKKKRMWPNTKIFGSSVFWSLILSEANWLILVMGSWHGSNRQGHLSRVSQLGHLGSNTCSLSHKTTLSIFRNLEIRFKMYPRLSHHSTCPACLEETRQICRSLRTPNFCKTCKWREGISHTSGLQVVVIVRLRSRISMPILKLENEIVSTSTLIKAFPGTIP